MIFCEKRLAGRVETEFNYLEFLEQQAKIEIIFFFHVHSVYLGEEPVREKAAAYNLSHSERRWNFATEGVYTIDFWTNLAARRTSII